MSSLRQKLIEEHLYLAERAASVVFRRVGGHMEWEELRALGYAGLTEAASRYDASAGASFSTYAWYRIQGAVLDGARKNSQVPLGLRRRLGAMQAASEALEEKATAAAQASRVGAAGAQDQVNASGLTDTFRALADAMGLAATATFISLDHANNAETLAAEDTAPSAADVLDHRRAARRIKDALASLPARERELIEKTYWQDMSLSEAGAALGLSRSWASRLHVQAITKLRYALSSLK